MNIAVASGKGGTGKTLLSSLLSLQMSEKNNVLLVDADVECPNDAIVLRASLKETRKVLMNLPVIDEEKCIKCGKCVRSCRYAALLQKPGEAPFLIENNCVGCNACALACPAGAISHTKKEIGSILRGKSGSLDILSGKVVPGYEESSRIVNELLKDVKKEKAELKIIDCAPGSHCSVIAAIRAADSVVLVAEPTLFGYHDYLVVKRLSEILKKKTYTVINKYEENEIASKIEAGGNVACRIPYSRGIAEKYALGEISSLAEYVKPLEEMFQ